jgi:hypothetical protein
MPNVLALAFHVDYWDSIGWHDHFALERYDVNLIAYLPQAATNVGRGENSGRTLREFNIVRQFRPLGVWNGQESVFRAPVESFPADATRVAVLLQRNQQGPIVGSATALLR